MERLGERLPLALLGFEGVGEQPRPALGEARDLPAVRRLSRSESQTHAAPIQARKPAWVAMKRAASGWSAAGWSTAWVTYAATVTTTATAVTAGRKRKATATGMRKNASRLCENAPPERTASMLIAAMSTPVAARARRSVAGRRYTHASSPALHAE